MRPSNREKREFDELIRSLERHIKEMSLHFLKGNLAEARNSAVFLNRYAVTIARGLRRVERRLKSTNNEAALLFKKKDKNEKDEPRSSER